MFDSSGGELGAEERADVMRGHSGGLSGGEMPVEELYWATLGLYE